MKYKITVFLLLMTFLGLLTFFPVSADNLFDITATDGTVANLTNTSVKKYWNPTREDSTVHIEISKGRTTDGIFVSWYTDDSTFTLTARDTTGNIVSSYQNGDKYDGYGCFYELDSRTRTIDIKMPARMDSNTGNPLAGYGIAYLKVSDREKEDPDLMKWKSPYDKCNLLVVSTHQDDEFIFLGGVIPTYLDQGYTVALAYTSTCSRIRAEEGLRGIWESGIRSYPTFIGFPDKGRKETIEEAAEVWGGMDQVILSFVREIRIRRPEVIVTHDEQGENYHNSHKVTIKAVEEAVIKAADSAYDPESAARYGTWQVSKLYSHLYKKNQISLNYHLPLSNFDGRTAYEVATAAYAYHESQKEFYQLSWSAIQTGGKYDNSLFGCVYSTVGFDQVNLFYGTPVYREEGNSDPGQPSVTTSNTTSDLPTTDPSTNTSVPTSNGESNLSMTISPTQATEPSITTASTSGVATSTNELQNTKGTTPTAKILIAFAVVIVLIAAVLVYVIVQKRWRWY